MADVERTLADLQRQDVVGRIWRRDHTVWKPQPLEITDRLGWLTVSKAMHAQVAGLRSFAAAWRPRSCAGPSAAPTDFQSL
jgi:glucose-6-phosphate isomerase/transaldolase/glucose-6-phosphate isomerase